MTNDPYDGIGSDNSHHPDSTIGHVVFGVVDFFGVTTSGDPVEGANEKINQEGKTSGDGEERDDGGKNVVNLVGSCLGASGLGGTEVANTVDGADGPALSDKLKHHIS